MHRRKPAEITFDDEQESDANEEGEDDMDIDGCSQGPQQCVCHQVSSNDNDDNDSASEETGDSNNNVSDHNDNLTVSGTLLREKISSEVKCNVLWYWFLHMMPNLTSSFHYGKSSKTPSANSTVRPKGWEKFTLKVHLERCNLQ